MVALLIQHLRLSNPSGLGDPTFLKFFIRRPVQVELRRLSLQTNSLVLCHSLIFGWTEVSLPRASSIVICQSTPR
jgi:hypothetical protein